MPDTAITNSDAIVCFYRGTSLVDLAVRACCRRPGQRFSDVPSHCSVILPVPWERAGFSTPSTLFEYVATGWNSRPPSSADYLWCYALPLPDKDAAVHQAETDTGRYRWWVDGAIGLARFIPNRWYLRWPKLSHLAYRHICSLYVKDDLIKGGWPCPHWLAVQDCPASPNDVLFAVRETLAAGNLK